MKEIKFNESVPIYSVEKMKIKFPTARCREVLEKKGKRFSDEQIVMIRDFLINISKIAYQAFERKITNEVIAECEDRNDNVIHLNKEESKEVELKNVA